MNKPGIRPQPDLSINIFFFCEIGALHVSVADLTLVLGVIFDNCWHRVGIYIDLANGSERL